MEGTQAILPQAPNLNVCSLKSLTTWTKIKFILLPYFAVLGVGYQKEEVAL